MALTFEPGQRRPVEVALTGVALWLMPAIDPATGLRSLDPVEVQRAPDSAGAPGAWTSIARESPLPSQGWGFIDSRPLTTSLWWYRYRHVRADGAVAGEWSGQTQHSVKEIPRANESASRQLLTMGYRATHFGDDGEYAARATDTTGETLKSTVKDSELVEVRRKLRSADIGGKEAFDDLFVLATKTVKVGTVAAPSSITKPLRIPATECIPESDQTAFFVELSGIVRPRTANVQADLRAACVLPKGVTITTFEARMYRGTTSDTASAALRKTLDDGTSSAIATVTHNTTGLATLSASLSQLVGDEMYAFTVSLKGVAAAADAQLLWFRVTYTMPDYSKGY